MASSDDLFAPPFAAEAASLSMWKLLWDVAGLQ